MSEWRICVFFCLIRYREVSYNTGGTISHDKRYYGTGSLEFHNRMRALDSYHKEMQSQINLITKKMEAKEVNNQKFKEVRKKELERELDELEQSLAEAKVKHQLQIKKLNDEINNGSNNKSLKSTRIDLVNNKLQFMRELTQFDPRWKDKLRAHKQMDLQRLQHKRRILEEDAKNYNTELDREIDYQIKKEKYDIYKLQKHAEIKQALLYGDKYSK